MINVPPSKFSTIAEAAQHNSIQLSKNFEMNENDLSRIVAGKEADYTYEKVLTLEKIPKNFVKVEYAVRGAIVEFAQMIQGKLDENVEESKPKIDKIIPANIGNPHAVGQLPITFHRQVVACLLDPNLIPKNLDICGDVSTQEKKEFKYPKDVYLRAKTYLSKIKSMGAYTSSQGVEYFRKLVAEWFIRRDSFECDPNTIFLTEGGTPAIRTILELLIGSEKDGILIPIPQYPLYSALITKLGGQMVSYYLDESSGWSLQVSQLENAMNEAKKKGITVKALVVINPGNPTGSVLTESQLYQIVEFCEKNKLLIIADEVYQGVIHTKSNPFKSLRKCVLEQYPKSLEIVSIHSLSKSIGECGLRGGFMQLENVSRDVIQVVLKLMSVMLCPNTVGQAAVASLVDPLKPSDPSYSMWFKETETMLNDLKTKAELAYQAFNKIPGLSCQPILGAMYAFPKIEMPAKAIAKGLELKIEPDLLYCKEMLEETGVICVPGSGFHEVKGTYHFRITILPDVETYKKVLKDLEKFQINFLKRYA